ncbi:hypothetical protein ZOD2009_01215 [Haladaptatus paucihalophilus DX253]|uniref:DUF6199 domain-containing protein n=1 Tax=Haladaptatus paucihalophilus DX253 TaxID=797209 RepID=E7QMS5_HALPU|nr:MULTISPECIES: hypothetical protein [Haladaptatus]EFW93720.1 hypothetical protein ZOD2009_01215 [Haladaptatus paucihalophilus DX253]GKZ15052.1 hypothetical protein HAL_29330 [Haladaptatus sp. T7]SHL48911.1 hypothetical protein SAMN05444342_3943 [Haladaptatus paucihalophilus DX253]
MGNPLGLFIALLGIAQAAKPYGFARFQEQMDAIGSKRRSSEVEPAEWKVLWTRVMGVILTVIGLGLLLG